MQGGFLLTMDKYIQQHVVGYHSRFAPDPGKTETWKEALKVYHSLPNPAHRNYARWHRFEIAVAQNWRCAICQCPLPAQFEIDHIVAIEAGGSDDKENV